MKYTNFESIVINYYVLQELELKFENEKNIHRKKKFEKIKNELIDKIFYLLRDTLYQMVLGELAYYIYKSSIGEYYKDICIGEEGINNEINFLKGNNELYRRAFELNPSELELIGSFFAEYDWEENYGGLAWVRITRILKEAFTKENLNKIIWIEKVLFLAHNTGLAFNKSKTLVSYLNKTFTQILLDWGSEGKMIENIKKVIPIANKYGYYYDSYYSVSIDREYVKDMFLEKCLAQFVRLPLKKEEILLLYIPQKYGDKKLILVKNSEIENNEEELMLDLRRATFKEGGE